MKHYDMIPLINVESFLRNRVIKYPINRDTQLNLINAVMRVKFANEDNLAVKIRCFKARRKLLNIKTHS